MMWPWTSGTQVRIERTLVWRTWSIDSELKRWSLMVRSSIFLVHFYFILSIELTGLCELHAFVCGWWWGTDNYSYLTFN